MNVTVSGRYNRATVYNADLVNPVAGPGSLNGNFTFHHSIRPAASLGARITAAGQKRFGSGLTTSSGSL